MTILATEMIVIFVLLLLNGVFAMSELAMMTAKRSRLEARAEESDDAGARAALDLAAHPTAFLSTVQVGITLIGVLAGAFGGVGIAAALAEPLRRVPWLADYASSIAFGLVVLAITYLSLIFGELVPKRIALSNPERVASLLARPMRGLSRVGGPLVRALSASTNFVLRIFGLGSVSEPGVTEQDIRALVEQGAETGAVQEAEREIVENTFRLGDRAVREVMTPRPDVQWVDLAEAPDVVHAQLTAAVGELVLVCEGEVDRVVGLVYAEDLLQHYLRGEAPAGAGQLRVLARPALFVPASLPAFRLLETFRTARQHAAVVLDEYGAVDGIVTLDDLLQSLVGDLPDAQSGDEGAMVREADGAWSIDAATPLADVAAKLDVDADDRDDVVTVGGLVMACLGHVPREGEHCSWAGWRVEVVRMAGRRIDRVRMSLPRRGGSPNGGNGTAQLAS